MIMRKPFKFTDLSEVRCARCRKQLKKNVLARKPSVSVCFDCFREAERKMGHFMVTAREVRTGKIRGRGKGRYV